MTARDELPSWGTPTVANTPAGPELVTNASNFIRGYDPRSGKELWRVGPSSKITAPTPIAADGLFVVASGRAPERPIFVVRAGARGDLTLRDGQSTSAAIAWSRMGRGSYMPTPLVYRGLPFMGRGFCASPSAADGKIYLTNEDGEMLVIAAGPAFAHVATNSMGELLMATPALSDGVMYVRSAARFWGRRKLVCPAGFGAMPVWLNTFAANPASDAISST